MTDRKDFAQNCLDLRDRGYRFVGLQTNGGAVSYFFEQEGQIVHLEQQIEEGTVRSIVPLFALADFAERQLYRDMQIKALGNINLLPRES